MSELDELRKKRLQELQSSQQGMQQDEEQKVQQQLAQLEAMVKPHLTPEALQRYGNIKIAHPELAISTLVALAQFIQGGKLNKVDDDTLKALLIRLQKPRREINIKRK